MAEMMKKRRRKLREEEEEFEEEEAFEEDDWDDEEEEEEEEPAPRRKKKATATKSTTSKRKVKKPVDALTAGLALAPTLMQIHDEITAKLFEREEIVTDLLRALIAGENILLLGPPGTAKSMLAEQFSKHVDKASVFKWLMNRTTDPADIVGPYSIKGMENDKFLRVTTGKLPEADFAFLDEIFKANEPSLNYLLSMLNEGVFYNDGKAVPVKLRLTIGASNEYPEDETLEAFYDRFIFRHWVNYIQDPKNRINMTKAARAARTAKLLPPTMITLDEIDTLQEAVHMVDFPDRVGKDFDRLIRTLNNESIYISDRRYVKAQLVMMANALLNGRDVVTGDDFQALKNVLWNKDPKELEIVEREVGKFVNPYESKLKDYLKKAKEVQEKTMAIENRTERAGEAVQANASLNEILGKMEDELEEAEKAGVAKAQLNALGKIVDEVGKIMDDIASECLKQTGRKQTRQW